MGGGLVGVGSGTKQGADQGGGGCGYHYCFIVLCPQKFAKAPPGALSGVPHMCRHYKLWRGLYNPVNKWANQIIGNNLVLSFRAIILECHFLSVGPALSSTLNVSLEIVCERQKRSHLGMAQLRVPESCLPSCCPYPCVGLGYDTWPPAHGLRL